MKGKQAAPTNFSRQKEAPRHEHWLIFLEGAKLPAHLQSAAPWLEKLRGLAKREGMTVAEFAFSYVRDTPGVTSVLVGAEAEWQVRDNLALLRAKPLKEQTRAEIAAAFADVPK